MTWCHGYNIILDHESICCMILIGVAVVAVRSILGVDEGSGLVLSGVSF